MILLPEQKKVIITPPHTGSGNLHLALCNERHGGRWVIGPCVLSQGNDYDHHVSVVPNGCEDYTVALVVRHPLSRLIGLWQHGRGWYDEHGPQWWCQRFGALPDFVEAVARQADGLSWFYRATICDLLQGQRVDELIRFESLADDVANFLGRAVDLRPAYLGGNRPWQGYFAVRPRLLYDTAKRWAAKDAERWGYELPESV